ncbi:MAG: GntR family transcriptional regulator [Spirochaetales bacterium]|jgi:DNA-binding GntR family transcriptional regulator|nr:GntR family transcriptional regulator [Spirochaetales bacterium]
MRAKKEEISSTIRNRIYAGYYWPREQLVEIRLAEEMNVSRTVIREVLRELATKGLVNTVPNKGTFVAELSYKKMKETLDIEAILESSAAYLATSRFTAEQLQSIDSLLEKSKQLELDDIQSWADYNWRFHKTIITSCGNKKLIDMIRENVRFVKYWFVQLSIPEEIAQRNIDHEQIRLAIAQKDACRVRELMEKHLLFAADELLTRIKTTSPTLRESEQKNNIFQVK